MTKATFPHAVAAYLSALSILLAPAACPAVEASRNAENAAAPSTAPAENSPAPPVPATQAADAGPDLRPRLELHVPSVARLVTETSRSRAGLFVDHTARIMRAMSAASADGIDARQAAAIAHEVCRWPDTQLHVVTFAPDMEGRQRWAVRVEWKAADLHERVTMILGTDAAATLFEGISIEPLSDESWAIRLPETTLGFILPAGESSSCLASHEDLPLPAEPFAGDPRSESGEDPLLVCRLNLTGTEKDSGRTFLSSFSFVTSLDYSCRVNDDGDWTDSLQVNWPPLSGMAAKSFFGRVSQTFFVPDEAFGAVVLDSMLVPAMLEPLAGFGPQVMMESSGSMDIVPQVEVGPMAAHLKSAVCVTLLPGTGFLPVPDVVVQARVKDPEEFEADLRRTSKRINEQFRQREQPGPWNEEEVRDCTVFWHDSGSLRRGFWMPAVMRSVVFVTEETDARENRSQFATVAWTSTSPERFVRRWLDLPRRTGMRHLPSMKKTNGQAWLNWRELYRWVHPYVDFGLNIVSRDALLPSAEEAEPALTDAVITAKAKYAGLEISHTGPVPMAVIAIPAMITASAEMDRSGGSDLARERLASQNLRVLYHHSKLFRSDIGRWPSEVAELDGYVDFAGNPHLLQLKLSASKRWSVWFHDLFASDDEEESDQEGDETSDIDDDLYAIQWGTEKWTLGIAPGTLEHLEKLYIDQDGVIHRVETTRNVDAAAQATTTGDQDSDATTAADSAAP